MSQIGGLKMKEGIILVTFNVSEEEVKKILALYNLAPGTRLMVTFAYHVVVPNGKEKYFCDIFNQHSGVDYAETLVERTPLKDKPA